MMNIGVPKERFTLEKRVMITPATAQKLVREGHAIFVETGAGNGVHISDEEYAQSGATIMSDSREMYKKVEMVVKLKAPLTEEFTLMRGLLLVCMFHGDQCT